MNHNLSLERKVQLCSAVTLLKSGMTPRKHERKLKLQISMKCVCEKLITSSNPAQVELNSETQLQFSQETTGKRSVAPWKNLRTENIVWKYVRNTEDQI